MFPRVRQPSWRATAQGYHLLKKNHKPKPTKKTKHKTVDTSKVKARFAEGLSITIQFNFKLNLKIQFSVKIQFQFPERLIVTIQDGVQFQQIWMDAVGQKF